MRSALLGALLVIVLSACRTRSRVSEATLKSPVARARGRALFREHCVLCHGIKADGNGQRHEGLIGKPADFTSAAWQSSVTPNDVFDAIRYGRAGTSMPAWHALDDAQVADLTAYVLSVRELGEDGGP